MASSSDAGIVIVVPRYAAYSAQGYYEFPLGLAYVSSALKHAGYSVDVINLNHCAGSVEDILVARLQERPCRYVLTGGLSAHYRGIGEVIRAVRKVDSQMVVVVGGGVVTASPELMFNHLQPDYVVVGEGEITIVELMRSLEEGDVRCEEVAGIGYRSHDGVFALTRPRDPIMDLDQVAWPDVEGFDLEMYLGRQKPNDNLYLYVSDHPRFYPVISSRGCPFSCTFCYHPLGQKYRSRSVDDFMAEITHVIEKYDVKNLAIFDEVLTSDRGRLQEICSQIGSLPRPVKWMCQLRVETVDKEVLGWLKNAGCFLISYGFESASDDVLKSMRKHITAEQIERAMRLTREAGIGVQGYFIYGDPAETPETARMTLAFWRQHRDYHITMGYVRPYPGSVLWEQAVTARGLASEQQLEFLDACVYRPPNLTTMDEGEWSDIRKQVQMALIENDHFGEGVSCERDGEEGYRLTIGCPPCGQQSLYQRFVQRVLGVFKITYRHCNQSMNMSPLVFPHVRDDYQRNLDVYRRIKEGATPVVVTPCMDSAEYGAMAEFFLRAVRVVGFMDVGAEKEGRDYMGHRIQLRSQQVMAGVAPETCFVIPLTRHADRVYRHLISLGVMDHRICRLDEIMHGDVIKVEDESDIREEGTHV